jgi:hypothetical protein
MARQDQQLQQPNQSNRKKFEEGLLDEVGSIRKGERKTAKKDGVAGDDLRRPGGYVRLEPSDWVEGAGS